MINFLCSWKSELLQLACELSAMLNYLKKKKGGNANNILCFNDRNDPKSIQGGILLQYYCKRKFIQWL